MTRRFSLLLALLALVALGVWSLLPARDSAPQVAIVDVAEGALQAQLALTGIVVNDFTVTLTALLDGEITSIAAREGDRVETGDVLATLDDAPPRAQLDKAEATLVLRGHELELAERRHERMESMSRAGDASPQAVEDSQVEIRRARAAESVARADLALAELALRNASVRAPYAGVVIEQAAETGQWVEAGTRLFTLVAEAGRAIDAEVDAGDFARVAVGQPVTLAVAEQADTPWDSTIVRVSESVTRGDDATGNTFTIRVALGDEAPRLLLGQQVDVDVSTANRDSVLVLPLEAIVETRSGDTHVWVLDDDVARRRSVSLGLRTIESAEVIDGLSAGDRVLLSRGQTLRDGQKVETSSS